MIWLLVAVSVLLLVWLLQAPLWLKNTLFMAGAVLTAGLLLISGPERALAPLVLFAVALGLLLPGGATSVRRMRVAPARGRRERGRPRGRAGQKQGSVENIDIPGYELLEKVGSGGMASVYRARKLAGGKPVALKIPMEQYVADAKFIRRFHREAEVAQRLNHPNIVRTYEHGSMGIRHYMVMEYVKGRSLESYVESGELDIELSAEIMGLVVNALQHIHSAGIIHRDIKPANVMITEGGIKPDGDPKLAPDAVKLMDFGIAGGKVLSRLTMTGARIGTPVYMSPEQARGLKLDHRSDIYSLGLVFYEMLTGQTAFKGNYDAIVHQQIFQSPPPPRQLNLSVPRGLDELVMQMIAKEPDERPTLEEIAARLEQSELDEAQADELPSRIVVTVSTRQGVMRVLDTDGSLHTSLGEIGDGKSAFSAAPLSVSVDSSGNYFAAVFEYQVGHSDYKMIHKLSPEGRTLTSFGAYGMQEGEFLYPVSVAVAPDDSVYVLDAESHTVQRFDGEGNYLSGFGGRGDGKGQFNEPRSISVGPDGDVYVLDYGNKRVQRFDAQGGYKTRWAFKVSPDQETLRVLDGLAVDWWGNVYISDSQASKVRRLSPEGKVAGAYSVAPQRAEAGQTQLDMLLDLGVDDEGNLYTARRGGQTIQKFARDGTLLGTFDTYAPVVQMTVDVRKVEEPVAGD